MKTAVLIGLIAITIAALGGSCFTVPEGNVAVLYRGGALLTAKGTMPPGLHFKLPFIDDVKIIQISMQTDNVQNLPCGTASGTTISFDKIEVVNRLRPESVLKTVKEFSWNYDEILIYQKIHQLINELCSKSTLQEIAIDNFDKIDDQLMSALQKDIDRFDAGVDIISVRVTKPRLPEAVRKAFEQKDAERANLALAQARANVAELEARAVSNTRKIQAEMEKEVKMIAIEKEIMEREGEKKKLAITDQIWLASEKAKADAALYKAQKEAEGHKLIYSDKFVELEKFKALAQNTKYYFGEKIPTTFYQQQLQEQGKSRND